MNKIKKINLENKPFSTNLLRAVKAFLLMHTYIQTSRLWSKNLKLNLKLKGGRLSTKIPPLFRCCWGLYKTLQCLILMALCYYRSPYPKQLSAVGKQTLKLENCFHPIPTNLGISWYPWLKPRSTSSVEELFSICLPSSSADLCLSLQFTLHMAPPALHVHGDFWVTTMEP